MRRRTKLIVDSVTQRRVVTRLALAPLLLMGIATGFVVFIGPVLFDDVEKAGAEVPMLGPTLVVVLTFFASAASMILLQALRFSHHVVGPAYRLEQALKQIRRGEFGFRVSLRTGDELRGLADEVNELIAWLEAEAAHGRGPQGAVDASASEEQGPAEHAEHAAPAEHAAR